MWAKRDPNALLMKMLAGPDFLEDNVNSTQNTRN